MTDFLQVQLQSLWLNFLDMWLDPDGHIVLILLLVGMLGMCVTLWRANR